MATRIFIAAARGVTAPQFLAAYPEAADDPPVEWGDWVGGVYSLWCSDPSDFAVSRIPGPVVRITTSDDAVWFLRIDAPGAEPFGAAFFHDWIADPEDDDDDRHERFGEVLVERYELVSEDCWPVSAVRELKDLPAAVALPEFLTLQAEATAAALEGAGIPHDRDELVRGLTGEGLSDGERESSLGNLPQFLACIGLGQALAMDEGDGADEGDDEDEDGHDVPETFEAEDEAPSRSHAEGVLVHTAGLSLDPIAGGPVPCPELRLAFLVASFCDPWGDPALVVELPEGTAAPAWPENPAPSDDGSSSAKDDEIQVEQEGDRVSIGLARSSLWRQLRWMKALGQTVAELPDGAVVTLHVADSETEEHHPTAAQAYRGAVSGGVWEMAEASPPLAAGDVEAALALAAEADDEDSAVRCRDEAEAHAILRAAEASDRLWPLPTLDGLELSHPSLKEELLRLVFLQRLGHAWSLDSAEQPEPGDDGEIGATEQPFSEALPATNAEEPADETLVFEGAFSRYRRAEESPVRLPGLDDVSDLFEARLREQRNDFRARVLGEEPEEAGPVEPEGEFDAASQEQVETEMAALGFEPLGGLVCEAFGDVVTHGFAPRDGGSVFGIYIRSLLTSGLVEFYTVFDDDTSLTTTTNAQLEELPHRGIRGLPMAEATPRELLTAHRAEIERLSTGRKPRPFDPTLEGLARALDAFLLRRMS